MTNFNESLICELVELRKCGIVVPAKTMKSAHTLNESEFPAMSISEIADLIILTKGKV